MSTFPEMPDTMTFIGDESGNLIEIGTAEMPADKAIEKIGEAYPVRIYRYRLVQVKDCAKRELA